MKQVQVVIPWDKTEEVYEFILNVIGIKTIFKFDADAAHLLQFRVPDEMLQETMEKLKSRSIGVEFGYIDIVDLKASLPRVEEESSESTLQREAILAVEEIYESVKSQTSLSFDFLAFVIISAVIAGIGLVQNNATIIVASMLLSPLMGPMLGVALGYVVSDRPLFIKGTLNELIALALSFAMGAIMGALFVLFFPSLGVQIDNEWTGQIMTEITRRGGFNMLDVGVAVFSGAAVAISVTRGDMSSLVGVAISAALMPPAVNVGIMIMLGMMGVSVHGITIGLGSLALLVMNIIIIDIAAIGMFRIKKLTPIAEKSAKWRAVTEFRAMKTSDLYHIQAKESTIEKEAATFTPASTTADTETEKPTEHKESKSENSSDQT